MIRGATKRPSDQATESLRFGAPRSLGRLPGHATYGAGTGVSGVHQPMTRDHLVLVYNGEIFNFRELRDELGGPAAFRGDGDTEVLLAALAARGLAPAPPESP